MSNSLFNVSFNTRVIISLDGEVVEDKSNNIHPQNMARIISRALSHEPNSYIYRLALGNGAVQYSSDGSVIIKPALDGSDGSAWQTRLYNETYSEVVDGTSGLVGTDPGSADANTGTRPGGDAVPADDPAPDSVVSQEVGTSSNVTITMYINGSEPTSQASSSTSPIVGAENDFIFNELALYSSGAQAINSSGLSTVNVGNATSTTISTLAINTNYNINITVDGISYTAVIATPSAGTGASGTITYGDICQGINSGAWILSGNLINNNVYVYITDDSQGVYPSILNKNSGGFLIFQSLSSGSTSTVSLSCSSGSASDFFNVLASGICGNVNYSIVNGENAGVANDPLNPTDERERLLTMLTFYPITKASGQVITINYILTVTVNPSVSTIINQVPTTPSA